MPDTFTHIALPFVTQKLFKRPLIFPLVLIGTVLPDYFREFFAYSLPIEYYPAVLIFHSIIGVIFTSLLLTSLFNASIRKSVFISLTFGQLIHLFFDSIQYYLCGESIYVFLPIWKSFKIGLISETYWIYLFIFSSILFIAYIIFTLKKKAN